MSKLTLNTLILKGKSTKQYSFNIYPIGEECKDESGIYVFTKRNVATDGTGNHSVIYIGMAESFQTRFYAHHKQAEIQKAGANCICLMQVPIETERIAFEKDLLAAYNTPCNETNN